MVGRIDVHVVLLGVHLKVVQIGCDRIGVIHDVPGVGDKLSTDHELILGVHAEGVAHSAVLLGYPEPAANRLVEALPLPENQIQVHDPAPLQQNVQRIGLPHIEAVLLEGAADGLADLA